MINVIGSITVNASNNEFRPKQAARKICLLLAVQPGILARRIRGSLRHSILAPMNLSRRSVSRSRMLFFSIVVAIVVSSVAGCVFAQNDSAETVNADLHAIFDDYYAAWLVLNPLEATGLGVHDYDHLLAIDISESHRNTVRELSRETLSVLSQFDSADLSDADQINRDVLIWALNTTLRMIDQPDHLMPVNQMFSMHLEFATQGSGSGAHPFESEQDFENFMSRMNGFSRWVDVAIQNMDVGIAQGVVLPRINVIRVIPQLQAIADADANESIFAQPLESLDGSNDSATQLRAAYLEQIENVVLPAYARLLHYMETTYLAASRESSGLTGIPGGDELYRESIRYWTTTEMRPDQIHELGLREVARIREEMDAIREAAGFDGSLTEYVRSFFRDPAVTPFSSVEEILEAYADMQAQMEPHLDRLFRLRPVTPFEVRQVEAYRAASSSAHYQRGAPDGSRPGIFYVPIFNPETFNVMGMESLFAHEAIPGHHYQISLQQESKTLPAFRNAVYFSAFTEGWALYTESLGEELGLYKSNYSDIGRLNSELFRAVRLVVDTGLHDRGWSREEAIEYMYRTLPAWNRQSAANQIERYMIMPGQALAYKLGELAILQMRDDAAASLGDAFDIRDFHDRLLLQGAMPLTTLNSSMQAWAQKVAR